jgi:hypothetical protein
MAPQRDLVYIYGVIPPYRTRDTDMPPSPTLAQQIRDRLDHFVDSHVGTRYRLEQRCPGIGHSTVTGWFKTRPTTPRADNLVELATRVNLNPNWLLLGEGPPLRGGAEPDLLVRYRDAVVAEVAAVEGRTRDEVAPFVPFPDGLLRAAVEQVRAFLHSPAADVPAAAGSRGERQARVIETIRWHRPRDGADARDTARPSEDGAAPWTSDDTTESA